MADDRLEERLGPRRGARLLPLVGLFLFVIARQLTWSLTNPLFQGPDEVVHIQMVGQLDKHGLSFYRLPSPVTWRDLESSYDFHQDWYRQKGVIANPDVKPLYVQGSRWGLNERENLHHSGFDRVDGLTYYRYQSYPYPPLYYWSIAKVVGLARSSGATLINYQFGMRLVQMAFYVLFIAAALLLTGEVIQDRFSRVWTFSCILFHPMLIFMGSLVNNDNGLLPFSLFLILGGVRLLKHPEDRPAIWMMAIAAICLTLTKATGFLLVLAVYPVIAGLLALSKRSGLILKLMPGFAVSGALFVLLPRWIGEFTVDGYTPGRLAVSQYIEIIFGWLGWDMTRNWLGQFAWFEVNFPSTIYIMFITLLGCAVLLSATHLATAIAKRKFDVHLKLFSFLFLTVLAVVLGALVYQYAVSSKFGVFIQGRYTLSALPLVYLCVGMILSSTLRQAKRRPVILGSYLAATGFLACLVCLSVVGLGMIVRRFFWNSGISAGEMVLRVMQYKPVLMKNSLGFAGLGAAYVLGHFGFVAYFAWFARDWYRQIKRPLPA